MVVHVSRANSFIRRTSKRSPFHASSFCSATKSTFAEPQKPSILLPTEFGLSLLYFMLLKLWEHADSLQANKTLFFNNMPLFGFDPKANNRRGDDNAKKPEPRAFFSMLKQLLAPNSYFCSPASLFRKRNLKLDSTEGHPNFKGSQCVSHRSI